MVSNSVIISGKKTLLQLQTPNDKNMSIYID